MPQDYNYRGDVVVFDLDDTLASERLFCISGIRHLEKELKLHFPDSGNVGEVTDLMIEALMNRTPHYDVLEAWLREKGIEPHAIMPDLVSACRNHFPDSDYILKDGASDLLELLRSEGIRMGLITDGRSITQRNKIKALGLSQFIATDAIFISGETGVDKGKPDNFESMVRLTPEAGIYWYVGDNPDKDFLWPNLLGWKTICLKDINNTNIHKQNEVEPPYSPHFFIDNLGELPSLLGLK